MYQEMNVTIEGVLPLMMGNGVAADPLNPMVKERNKVSRIKNKTDAHHIELERIDWDMGLYLDGNAIVLPAENFNASLIEGARKTKKGKQAETCVVKHNAPLEFPDKRKSLDSLYKMGTYTDRRMVFRNRKARIPQVSPIFPEWAATFTIGFDDEVCSEDEIKEWIKTAGQLVGVGAYRRRFGKYRLVE